LYYLLLSICVLSWHNCGKFIFLSDFNAHLLMNIVYLNGDYIPLQEARISPLDRGFLFGEGIYEVIPSYAGRYVGFDLHMQRMAQGLKAIAMPAPLSGVQWREVGDNLLARNKLPNAAIYLHVSRGAAETRSHSVPAGLKPTIFAFVYAIAPLAIAGSSELKEFKVVSSEDLRWKRCSIKSTSLLGNILHYQQGKDGSADECILYNSQQQLTEASSSNVFVVKGRQVTTPPTDNQILPGITRHIVLDILRQQGDIDVQERPISMDEVRSADEIWLSSSSKGIVPVTSLDGVAVGTGKTGDMWQQAQSLYIANNVNY
jgi:D-alanine transaminase